MITEDTIFKNPTELIEGDIMILTHTVWENHYMIFEVRNIDNKLVFIHKKWGFSMEFKNNEKYPVIGNIKKTPNLLREKGL